MSTCLATVQLKFLVSKWSQMNLTVLPKPSIIKSRPLAQHQKCQVTIACSKMIQSRDAWKSKRFQITHDKNYFIFNFTSLQCFLCFAFFCSVNHFGEGEVNADHNVTCSPSLAENDSDYSRIVKEIAMMGGFFVEGRRQTLLYSCK